MQRGQETMRESLGRAAGGVGGPPFIATAPLGSGPFDKAARMRARGSVAAGVRGWSLTPTRRTRAADMMDQLKSYADDRLINGCVYCGGPEETRDHVPSRVFL